MKPEYGFVLGKFMPPHNGHVFLCEFAKNSCQHLTILVCSLPDEPIPGHLRYQWMKEMFDDGGRTCTVLWTNEVLPQEPIDDNDTAFWSTWKRVVESHQEKVLVDKCHMFREKMVDAIFASEEYGHKLAETVGAKFIPCDMIRQTVPVSGTLCRKDIVAQWQYLPANVRSHYVKRVVLFGPESSGKSTLAKSLGEHLNTVVVPEYGRTYTEAFGPDVDEDDLVNIVHGHLASVKAAKKLSGPIMIEDTDPIMTGVWSVMLVGERDPWFSDFEDHGDLYILCDVDIPWVDDGTRYFPKEEDRKRFFDLCERELISRGVRYITVRGSVSERLEASLREISKL